jgi:hypothetical protein
MIEPGSDPGPVCRISATRIAVPLILPGVDQVVGDDREIVDEGVAKQAEHCLPGG